MQTYLFLPCIRTFRMLKDGKAIDKLKTPPKQHGRLTVYNFKIFGNLETIENCLQTCLKPIKPLNAGVSSSTSIISLLATLGDFGGRPPPVILVSLLNSANSFLAMLWRFFHLSFTSVTVRLAVPTAFTAWVISSHTICFFFLVTASVNLDGIKSRFF